MAKYQKAPQDIDEAERAREIRYQKNLTELSFDEKAGEWPLELPDWDGKLPPGFLVIYGGKRRSGKSVHIRWLLQNNDPDQYLLCLCMTRTPETGAYQGLFGEEWVHNGWNPELAKRLIETGKANVKKNGEKSAKNKILLVLDDIIGEQFHDDKTMNDFAALGRHYDIDIIVTTQYPKAINPKVRTNCDVFIGFELDSRREEEAIINDYFSRLGKAALPVYEHYTEGYNAIVALKHERARELTKKFKHSLADPDIEDFPMGCPEQRKEAERWTRERKSKQKQQQDDNSTSEHGEFSWRSSDRDSGGSGLEYSIQSGLSRLNI